MQIMAEVWVDVKRSGFMVNNDMIGMRRLWQNQKSLIKPKE